ncbi:gliding motility-associated ABC transporter permease subunit GldF [Peijinzhouia sedimentorum]
MRRILAKELNAFFSSIAAYLVLGIFLVVTGLLMWVFPDTAVLSYGYADMSTLFTFGPYIFLFLVPAITMRLFAEENKGGTMELLLTKPLRDWDIIVGKYFAGIIIILVALIPTLIYYYSVYALGNPVGNIDSAGVTGSYIGLFLLAAVFCAAGLFASSLTENQILAFLLGAFLCFLIYAGFDGLSRMSLSGSAAYMMERIGILYHYEAMSKGLLDSRDIYYFICTILLFLFLTKMKISSRKW